MVHFGVKLIDRGKGFRLTKENFALVDIKPSLPFFQSLAEKNAYTVGSEFSYREEWCYEYRELCLRNYDLNMKFFSLLDSNKFNIVLESFLGKHEGFEVVLDLAQYAEVEGYYIMVLDEYKQAYIGKTKNIKKRIMQHWSETKSFDRLLFPMYAYDTSCFSIDFFRALDTTRIYAWKQRISNGIEEKLIQDFPAAYCSNRIGGDITGLIEAIATMNKRQL